MDILGDLWNKSSEAVGSAVEGAKVATGQVLNPIGDGLIFAGEKVNETSKTLTGGHWDGPVRDEYHLGFFSVETRTKPKPREDDLMQMQQQQQRRNAAARAEMTRASQEGLLGTPDHPRSTAWTTITPHVDHKKKVEQAAQQNRFSSEGQILEKHRKLKEKLQKEAEEEKRALAAQRQ